MEEAVRNLLKPYVDKPAHKARPDLIVEDGFFVDPATGLLHGRYLELDANNGNYCPIYFYNRSWRFIGLFHRHGIHVRDQAQTLKMFEALECVWEKQKQKYNRTYFLTQTLILREIVTRLGIASLGLERRPISDLRRYTAQIKIFNDLWDAVF